MYVKEGEPVAIATSDACRYGWVVPYLRDKDIDIGVGTEGRLGAATLSRFGVLCVVIIAYAAGACFSRFSSILFLAKCAWSVRTCHMEGTLDPCFFVYSSMNALHC